MCRSDLVLTTSQLRRCPRRDSCHRELSSPYRCEQLVHNLSTCRMFTHFANNESVRTHVESGEENQHGVCFPGVVETFEKPLNLLKYSRGLICTMYTFHHLFANPLELSLAVFFFGIAY